MQDTLGEIWFKAACSLDEIKTKFVNNCGLPNVSGSVDCAKISVFDDQIANLDALIGATRHFKYPNESSTEATDTDVLAKARKWPPRNGLDMGVDLVNDLADEVERLRAIEERAKIYARADHSTAWSSAMRNTADLILKRREPA
jgi:hypothetical protein